MNSLHSDFASDDEILLEGVAPKHTAHGHLVLKRQFLPWHKPRKNWIRKHQWNCCIGDLISQLRLHETGRPLDYLCLPGQDLLDIRALSPVCKQLNVMLRFLGLNYIDPTDSDAAERTTEQAISLSEVHGMTNIHEASEVLPDKFESISDSGSITHDRIIHSRDTFDVINIDLCGSFGEAEPAKDDSSLYNALFHLFHKQATFRTDDWLFFLTTRNNTDKIHNDVWKILIDVINKKRHCDNEFADNLISTGIINNECLVDGDIVIDSLTRNAFVGIFSIGIGLWIVDNLINFAPGWKAEMLPSYGYHVYLTRRDANCDMISLAFRCTRIQYLAEDIHGLAGQSAGTPSKDPNAERRACDSALLREYVKQTDLDVRLCQNIEEYETAFNESIALLGSARYDINAYKEFADKSFNSLQKYLRQVNLI